MGSGKRIEPYSGIEAKAHPFTGVDEADYWKSLHGMEPSRSFIFNRNVSMISLRRSCRPVKQIISGFEPHHV